MDYLNNVSKLTEYAVKWLVEVVPSVLMAIAILVIGWLIAGVVSRMVERLMKKANMDVSLVPFFKSLINTLLKVIVVISAAGVVGVETTSFVAVLGAAGLAIGLALQGSLGNFAGGVLILIFKPIRVGDYIEAQGTQGVVEEIQIFCTVITTIDNKTVILPNGPLAGGVIVNYTKKETRRVDMTFGVSYGDDIDKVKSVIKSVLDADSKVLKSPAADIFVSAHGANSVDFAVRPWVKTADYWDVYFNVHEQLKKKFDENNISIPFPQRDVHIIKEG